MPPGVTQQVYILENLGCANCAAKMERKINNLSEVEAASITFATKKLVVASKYQRDLLPVLQKICSSIESEVIVKPEESMPVPKEKKSLFAADKGEVLTIGAGAIMFAVGIITENIFPNPFINGGFFIAAYLILGL